MPNLPVRRSSLLRSALASREDRATGQALAAIQSGAFLERASDEAHLMLVLGRMRDTGQATECAIDEGDRIVANLARRLEANPLGAKALSGLAEEGIDNLRAELGSVRNFVYLA